MKISVIIPVYNHEKYISAALKSALDQNYGDIIEYIILNDASIDNTQNIIIGTIGSVENVRLVTNQINLGIVKNYQKAFSLCKGDLIFVLEGDDYWINPDKISIISNIMKAETNVSMCFHDYQILDQQKKIKDRDFNTDISNNVYISTEDLIDDSSIIGNYSVCCYRKEFVNKIPDSFWENNTNDWGLNMLMGTFGQIRYCSQKMSVYRLHNESLWTGETTLKKYRYILDIIPYYKSIMGVEYFNHFEELEIKISGLIRQLNESTRPHTKIKNYIRKIIS